MGLLCLGPARAEWDASPPAETAAIDQQTCGNDCDCLQCCRPCWTATADALWLHRSGTDVFLGQTLTNPGGVMVDTLSSNDVDFPMEAGVRLRLACRSSQQITWEVLYFGLQRCSQRNTIFADPLEDATLATSPWTQTDKLIGGFDQSLGYAYTSTLHDAEVNRRRQWDGDSPWTWETLMGFRYFQWEEAFHLNGVDQFFGVFENIDVYSRNFLVGAQIGAQLQRDWDRFQLVIDGKAGLFADFVQQRRSNLSSNNISGGFPRIEPIDDRDNTTGVAGAVDLSVMGCYRLTPCFWLRGGYQLLYVAGLALGPDQLGSFSHHGDLFLHGPAAGLELNW